MSAVGRTLPFTARPARLTDRPVSARAVTEPRLALALIARLTAEYAPGCHITRRELAESRQIPRHRWYRAPRHYSASLLVVTRQAVRQPHKTSFGLCNSNVLRFTVLVCRITNAVTAATIFDLRSRISSILSRNDLRIYESTSFYCRLLASTSVCGK